MLRAGLQCAGFLLADPSSPAHRSRFLEEFASMEDILCENKGFHEEASMLGSLSPAGLVSIMSGQQQ
jgi:hypothetical protein